MLLLLLLLELPPDSSLLELLAVGIRLHLPLAMLVLLELALFVELSEQILCLEGLLRLGLLDFELVLQLPVLLLQLLRPRPLAQLLFLQFGELGLSPPSLGPDLQHVDALAVARCTK